MLWFLGSAMENHWGAKRFLTYYLLTGLGASALQIGVNAIEYFQLSAALESGAPFKMLFHQTRQNLGVFCGQIVLLAGIFGNVE